MKNKRIQINNIIKKMFNKSTKEIVDKLFAKLDKCFKAIFFIFNNS